MPAAVDYDAIANILTLRYNPRRSPPKRPLAASDFAPSKVDDNVESQILKIIESDLARIKEKRVSVLLSGGVDSVLTLAVLRKFRPDINVSCVSMGFGEDDDEVSAARNIAEAYGCDFCALVLDDVLSGLPRLIKIAREPRWNLYQAYAFEACKEKTIFSGDGGDELFAGYTFRYQKYLSLFSQKKNGWKEKAKLYVSCHERDWVPDQEKVFGPKVRFSWDKIYGLVKRYFSNNGLDPLDQVFLADWNGKLLFDWLPANLAFSKAFEIKIQSLFLSDRMTKFATHLPWRIKYDQDSATGKLPLRAILKGERLRVEPVKKGFSANAVSLWKKRGQEIVKQYVNNSGDSETVRAGVINGDWVQKTTEKLLQAQEEPDIRYVNKMLAVLALEVWWRLFVSKTLKGNEKL
ncbi:asparagine synthase (glutamine-hydrolyzing) [Candidatus Nitrososphaera evergladensis SR1]|uniref:Asparagine synthase (Glutamine-hydrolyzing) n=1 Tax=Candidatus Nitrososphaera evergladensis SR1 TaxID=1459636 RepID=A0A075MSY7_9ARCH|nr:asparagine synthase C-terminal domain-containing protein [Candidatus Nitrososphaera evergladensis]AIF84218.1 asparagine synthase (glutamine-hydrolyzing) [Candidatus Nitrososphaera evergladensis SR1]